MSEGKIVTATNWTHSWPSITQICND